MKKTRDNPRFSVSFAPLRQRSHLPRTMLMHAERARLAFAFAASHMPVRMTAQLTQLLFRTNFDVLHFFLAICAFADMPFHKFVSQSQPRNLHGPTFRKATSGLVAVNFLVTLMQIVDMQADRTDPTIAVMTAGMIMDVAAHRAFDLIAAIGRTRGMLLIV